MFCSSCGTEINNDTKYCSSCGAELNQAPTDNNSNTDMGDLYKAAIGYTKSHYYLPRFNKYDTSGSKASWNWPAFFVTFYWLLYRKM